MRITSNPFHRQLQWAIKRALEWVIAGVLLLFLAPFLLFLAVLIKIDSPGPALFVQDRLGSKGRVFRMYKFRSLEWEPGREPVCNADGSTWVAKDDQRLTGIGRYLRLGFDELPQLWNVVKGEMALLGPRPDEPFQRKFYTETEERKLCVLPGISGLAQALGRNAIPWKQRIRLDLHYIDNYSLWLDLKIVLLTLLRPCSRNGIYFQVPEAAPSSSCTARRSVDRDK